MTDKQALLQAYCQHPTPALRNAVVEAYLYLAQAVARRFAGRGVELEDLTQVASMALIKAIDRFDCAKGLAFTTFAMPTLAGEVRNYLRDRGRAVRIPRRGAELYARIARTRESFLREQRQEPTMQELADALQVRQDDILDALEMQRTTQALSLDAALGEEGGTLEHLLGREEEAFGRIEDADAAKRLLDMLEGPMRFVLEERFLHQRSQRDVAAALGVSQMQVSRLERRALAVLRAQHAV